VLRSWRYYRKFSLFDARAKIQSDSDAALVRAARTLLRDAEDALEISPVSVMLKNALPPSEDLHDYLSQAPYFWPDPLQPDGLPYIRKDGEVNPESTDIADADNIDIMERSVGTLALAWFFLRDVRYAEHAALLLNTWFLNEDSRMNPHLDYAQIIPGNSDARANGIVEGHVLARIPDWSLLLEDAPAWSVTSQRGLRAWFKAYAGWLRNSPIGRLGARELKNNQGTWYWVQLASAALFGGDKSTAASAVRRGSELIASQIRPDGSQPRELDRTRPLGYSVFNLRALFTLAELGEHVAVPLWCTPALRSALDYTITAANNKTSAALADASTFRKRDLAELAHLAANALGATTLLTQSKQLDSRQSTARYLLSNRRTSAGCPARN
jgi:hypothetical protein